MGRLIETIRGAVHIDYSKLGEFSRPHIKLTLNVSENTWDEFQEELKEELKKMESQPLEEGILAKKVLNYEISTTEYGASIHIEHDPELDK